MRARKLPGLLVFGNGFVVLPLLVEHDAPETARGRFVKDILDRKSVV